MVVEITSEVLGKVPGETYTGELEGWLLAEGYAKQAAYEGAGVSNTGVTSVDPGDDPRLAENREAPYFPLSPDRNTTIANDADNLNEVTFPAPTNFDVDPDATDTEAPVVSSLDPAEGPEEGGTVVRIYGDNLEGVIGVTFDAVAGTALDVSEAENGYIDVTTPAGTAGTADVAVTDAVGTDTEVAAFTYLATP